MINIVILGGGFGGIRTALDLDWKLKHRKDIRIILIDKNNAQTFYPNLYEVASVYGMDHQHPYHTKLKETICIPYAEIFAGTRVEVVTAEVIEVNLEAKHITTAGFNLYPFDYLIIALGSVPTTFGVPGADEYAFKFKSVEDGLMLADKIEELYRTTGNGKKQLPVRIIVGGGGFTGVELAAELTQCTKHVAHQHGFYQNNCTSITIVEAGPAIMGPIGQKERIAISRRLNHLGITVMVNAPIAEIQPNQIKLKDGTALPADMVIWSGGVKASPLLKKIAGLVLDDKERIIVNQSLLVSNYGNVFAVGDNNTFTDSRINKPVPQVARVAIEQGKVAAENISRLVCQSSRGGGVNLQNYEPEYSAWVTPVGGKQAVAYIGGRGYSGFVGYLIRQAIELRYFLSILSFFKALKLFFDDVVLFSEND